MSKTRISMHLAQRLMNTPLAVHGSYLKTMIGALQGRGVPVLQLLDGQEELSSNDLSTLASDYMASHQPKAGIFDDEYDTPMAANRPYQLLGNIAVIRVEGSLVHKYGHLQPYSGMTGYDGIRACIDLALDDRKVKAIALDCDSPGGEVAGCFALGDYIYSHVRGKKPIWALVNELAASACFALASACDQIYITETAQAGSVGVICAHTDASEAVANAGFKITLFYSGTHKADYNSYEPLSEELSQELQAEMVDLHELFSAKVALWRGMDVKQVLGTESRVYRGKAAVDVGLVDAVASVDEFYRKLIAATGGQETGDSTVKKDNQTVAAAATLALAGTSVAAAVEADEQGQVDAATAERQRIMGIMGLDEAKSRSQLAQTLADTPGMSVDQAKTILSAAAEEPSKTAGTLNQLMSEHASAPLGEEEGELDKADEVGATKSLMTRAFGAVKK